MVWTPLPTTTPEGKAITYVRPAHPTVRGYEVVDPKTGIKIGHIPEPEYARRQPGQRKYRGETFVKISARPEVAAKIRSREEKREARELAEKREEIAKKVPTKPTDVKYYLTKEGKKLYWKGEPPAHIKERIVSEISEEEYKYAKVEKPPEIKEKEYLVRPVPTPEKPEPEWKPRKELVGKVEIEVPEKPEVLPTKEKVIPKPTMKEPKEVPLETFLTGEIKAAPKVPWYEKPSELARRLAFKAEKKVGIPRVPYTVGAFALGAVSYPVELGKMIARPIKTVKGLAYTITHPMETGYEIGRRLKFETPIVAGEAAAMIGLGYVTPKIARKVTRKVITPKVKIAEISLWKRTC